MASDYWNHNVAFHRRIVRDAALRGGSALDVGCGDGLLLARLATVSRCAVGLETDEQAVARARRRLEQTPQAEVLLDDVMDPDLPRRIGTFETVSCVATLHHLSLEPALVRLGELVAPGGRLHEQRDVAYRMLNEIDGISCNQSDGALYLFPKVDTEKFNIVDDEKFMLDLLKEQKILFSHGGAFNWHKPDHFRLVFLPDVQTLTDALNRLGEFLSDYKQRA